MNPIRTQARRQDWNRYEPSYTCGGRASGRGSRRACFTRRGTVGSPTTRCNLSFTAIPSESTGRCSTRTRPSGYPTSWRRRGSESTRLERGRAPTLEARKRRRRLKLPRLTAALPVRPKLIHARIPCRIITERVAPALSNRSLEQLFRRSTPRSEARGTPFHLDAAWRMLLRIPRIPNSGLEV
jgi:hypothetical protein